MSRTPARRQPTLHIALAVTALASVSACGATTYESDATIAADATTTTSLPSGPAAELLPRLKSTMNSLSGYIGPDANQTTPAGKQQVLDTIDSLWNAVVDEVTTANPDAADSIGRMVDLAHTAVERNRPADADKAAKFAGQVIDEFLTR